MNEAYKKMTNEVEKRLRERCWLKEQGGEFIGEIYADYRDEMDNKTAAAILESDDPGCSFWEKLDEWYGDARWHETKELREKLRCELTADDGPYPNGFTDEESGLFESAMEELVYFEPLGEHFLKQEFCVNIMVDTGDGNYDYTLNSVYPCWYGRYEHRLDDKASIVWLARQQGYTKTQLWRVLMGDVEAAPDSFLASMRQEVVNVASHMMTMTFLVKMTLRDLIELNRLVKLQDREGRHYDARENPDCGYIIIDKGTMTGLYDPWGGGGSVLEVKLDKDVKLPIKFIRSALPDGGDGYSVEEVYGMCGSAWAEDGVKLIHCPKKLREGVA